MKSLLFGSFLFFISLLLTFSSARGEFTQEIPCLYGVRLEGECNPAPIWANRIESAEVTDLDVYDDFSDDAPCLCGISTEEEGACIDTCDELQEDLRELLSEQPDKGEQDDDACLYGIASPGECRNELR